MQKLLIAEHSEVRTDALTKVLQKEWEIHSVTTSYPVIDTMKYINPDAMIINLNIGPKDGLSVLKDGFPNLPPVILGLTNFVSPYILQTAESLGVGSIVQVPCTIEHIKDQLDDMHHAYLNKPSLLGRHLHVLGISSGWVGYRCLLSAIPFLKSDPNMMLKEIYPVIADLCELNDARCVEHAIRTAIHTAWENRDEKSWSFYFPSHKQCPSNKEFISRFAELL